MLHFCKQMPRKGYLQTYSNVMVTESCSITSFPTEETGYASFKISSFIAVATKTKA